MDLSDIWSSSAARSAVDYPVQVGSEKAESRWSPGLEINENCLTHSCFQQIDFQLDTVFFGFFFAISGAIN